MSDEKVKSGFLQNLTKKQKIVFGVASTLVLVAVAVAAYLGLTGKLKIGAAETTETLSIKRTLGQYFPADLNSFTFSEIQDTVGKDMAKLGLDGGTYHADTVSAKNNYVDTFASCTQSKVQAGTFREVGWQFVFEALDTQNKVLARQYSGAIGNDTLGGWCHNTVAIAPKPVDYFAYPPGSSQLRVRRLWTPNTSDRSFNSRDENQQTAQLPYPNTSLQGTYPDSSGSYSGGLPCQPGPGQVAVYAGANYSGRCTLMNAGEFADAAKWKLIEGGFANGRHFNDIISSIKLNQAKVNACTAVNYGGTCQDFTADTANLAGTVFHDSITSVKVTSFVTAGGGATISIAPEKATIPAGRQQQYKVSPLSSSTDSMKCQVSGDAAYTKQYVTVGPPLNGSNDSGKTWYSNIDVSVVGSAPAKTGLSLGCTVYNAQNQQLGIARSMITITTGGGGTSSITIAPTSATLAPGGAAQKFTITATNPNKYALDCQAFLGTFDSTKLTQNWVPGQTTSGGTYEVTAKADATLGATGKMRCAFNNTGNDTAAGKFNVDSAITIGTTTPPGTASVTPNPLTCAAGETKTLTLNGFTTSNITLAQLATSDATKVMRPWFGSTSNTILTKCVATGTATLTIGYGGITVPVTVSDTVVTDKCLNVTCPTGQTCDPADGKCKPPTPPSTDLEITSFTADPTQVQTGGGSTKLTWVLSRDATKCEIDKNLAGVTIGNKAGTNEQTGVPVQADTTYTLTCDTKSATAKVTVASPTCTIGVSNYVANPTSVALGGTTTLTWTAAVTGTGCTNDKVTCTINGSAATSGGTQKPAVVGSNVYALVCSSEHAAPVTKTVTVTATGAGQCGAGKTALPIITDKWWVKTLNTVPQAGKTLAHVMGTGNLAYFFDGFGKAYGKGESAKATDYVGLGFWAKKKVKDSKDYICVDSTSAVGATATKALPHKALNMIGTPLASVINPHTQLKFKFSSESAKMYTLDQAFEAGLVKAYFIWDGTKYLSFTNLKRYPSFAKYGYQPFSAAPNALQSSNGAWIATRSTENVTLVVGQ